MHFTGSIPTIDCNLENQMIDMRAFASSINALPKSTSEVTREVVPSGL